jgi:hypothetical protein
VCKIGVLTLRKELRLGMFEKRVLRRIFGAKREEEQGGWRLLHNEELHNLHSSSNITNVIKSRRISWQTRLKESASEV